MMNKQHRAAFATTILITLASLPTASAEGSESEFRFTAPYEGARWSGNAVADPTTGDMVAASATATAWPGNHHSSDQAEALVLGSHVFEKPIASLRVQARISAQFSADEFSGEVNGWVSLGATHDACGTCTASTGQWLPIGATEVVLDLTLTNTVGGDIPPGRIVVQAGIHTEAAATLQDGWSPYGPGLSCFLFTGGQQHSCVYAFATGQVVATVREISGDWSSTPRRGVDLSPDHQEGSVARKGTITYDIAVTNNGNADDTILLSHSANQGGWRASLSAAKVGLLPGESVVVQLTVKAPNSGPAGSAFTVTVTGTSGADAATSDVSIAETRLA